MPLLERVNADIAEAMKARDQARLAPIRMLKAALVNRQVERGRDLTDAEALQVVASLIKQRRDSAEQYAKGGRTDLVERETSEIPVLEAYLPPAMDEAEVERVVEAAVAETGASSPKDMGRVMKAVMSKLAGQPVDGKHVNELVRRRLAEK